MFYQFLPRQPLQFNLGQFGSAYKSFPSVVQRTSGAGAARATSFSPSWSATVSGNLLVLELGVEANGAAPSTPGGWSVGPTSTANGSGIRHSAFYKVSTGGETGVTISQGNNAWSWIMREVSGQNTAPIWGTNSTGTSSSPNPPSVAVGSAGHYLIIGGAAYVTTTTSSYSANYLDGLTASATGANLVRTASAERQLIVSTSEDPGTMTIGASAAWVGYTWAVGNV